MSHDIANKAHQAWHGDSDRIPPWHAFFRSFGQPIRQTFASCEDASLLLPLRNDEWRKAVHKNV